MFCCFSEHEENPKRRRNQKEEGHIEYDSLEKYGYHFKSNDSDIFAFIWFILFK